MSVIGYIGSDDALFRELKRTPGVDDVLMVEAEAANTSLTLCELLLISDRAVPVFRLEELKARYPDKKMVYLSSYAADASVHLDAAMICRRLAIAICPPKRTIGQLVAELKRTFLGGATDKADGGSVIALLGTLPGQSGVTATTLALADALSRQSELKVGVIGLNALSPGDAHLRYEGKYLNELYTQIKDARVLSPEELGRSMHPVHRFFYLAGNRDLAKKYRYPLEAAEHVIACARARYDVVLLDAGASPDNNLALQALLAADLRIVVGTQQPASVEAWTRMAELLQSVQGAGREAASYLLLLNKYQGTNGLPGEVATAMELPLLGKLPHLHDAAVECEMDRRLLSRAEQHAYNAALQQTLVACAERFGWSIPLRQRKHWWQRNEG